LKSLNEPDVSFSVNNQQSKINNQQSSSRVPYNFQQ